MTQSYNADPAILNLGDEFFDPVTAADFPKTILRFRDDVVASDIGLSGLSEADWIGHFGRFDPLPDNLPEPLALRYHGHQFQNYNADLGDGRGFLFAQLRDGQNRLLDLGTKGSGQTPYSRRGDGRLTLLGGVREALATRYLEHLGVPTSRTLSLIETGEDLTRHDEPSPTRSAVMVRLQHSHIRFGTFQRQAFFEARDNLSALVDYCITHFYPNAVGADGLLAAAAKSSANMVASWMAGGFVHGVMNTDNMNITGESFDYGPYRFLPTLQSSYTAAYFDHNRLYAFARQPEIMYWNLAQLAQSLSLICDDKALLAALEVYAPAYRDALRGHMFRRLSIAPTDIDTDIDFVMQTFKWLEDSQAPWPQFWHDFNGGAARELTAKASPNKAHYQGEAFEAWFKTLSRYTPTSDGPKTDVPPSLLYDEIGELWAPIDADDDWSAFEAKIASFTRD
ncbi:protein adenylyltransferase SelO family protein [Fretibacter rubidus]|uniref:protein adenylyltransferase SelO family protein n=1 Tax=Fretibacter rubidus TaxID=570162 RepID=UPI00352BCB73